jgi:hypothetical protein
MLVTPLETRAHLIHPSDDKEDIDDIEDTGRTFPSVNKSIVFIEELLDNSPPKSIAH